MRNRSVSTRGHERVVGTRVSGAAAWLGESRGSRVSVGASDGDRVSDAGSWRPEANREAGSFVDARADFRLVDRFCQPISSNTSRNEGVLHTLVACTSGQFVDNLCAERPICRFGGVLI